MQSIPGRTTTAGGLIIQARRKAGMSQGELARAVDVSPSMISIYEGGQRDPSITTLLKILKGAHCSLRLELTPYDDHDDTLNNNPERLAHHLDYWAKRAAAEQVARTYDNVFTHFSA
jgi:transcriptional regulator with XRE-family HTH domain